METTFDYQRDIAPAIPRFFGEIQSNTKLSDAAKQRLQAGVFAGAEDITKQRMAIQAERERSVLNQMRMNESRLAMEEDAMRREKTRRETERIAQLDASIKDVVGQDIDPTTKSQRLAELELEFSDITASVPEAGRRFDLARGTLPLAPKSMFTPSQMVEQAAKGVPPEVIASGDPMLIGKFMGLAAERDAEIERRAEVAKAEASQSKSVMMDMLTSDLEFQKPDPNALEPRPYMTDAAHARAKFLVNAFGTEEEKAEFERVKSPVDDRPRAALAERIRVRRLGEIARGAVEGPPRVTGASIVRGG
jgi:hypothetical protein